MTAGGPELGLTDTHAHLQEPGLRDDLAGVLARARDAGVSRVIAVGMTAADSAEVIQIVRDHPGVFATVGVHPNYAAEAAPGDWDRVAKLAGSAGVVALGETGLDRYWDRTPFDVQQDWFGRHLDLASQLGLPVVIHCREAEADILAQLRALARPVRGVLHSFTGDRADAEAFLELGLHLSFAGMVTFKNKKLDALREAATLVPADRLLVETDSPYLSPHPHRGRPNEPARVALTAAVIAEVRGMSLPDLAALTTENARRLFGLPDGPGLV